MKKVIASFLSLAFVCGLLVSVAGCPGDQKKSTTVTTKQENKEAKEKTTTTTTEKKEK